MLIIDGNFPGARAVPGDPGEDGRAGARAAARAARSSGRFFPPRLPRRAPRHDRLPLGARDRPGTRKVTINYLFVTF